VGRPWLGGGAAVLNTIILIGRLTRDPELRYTPSGIAVCSFSLAVDRRFTTQQGEKETDFIDIVVWRQQAERVAEHMRKGRMCAVQGRLQIRNYEDRDGNKRKAAEVVAEDVRFLDSPRRDGPPAPGHAPATGEAEFGDDEQEVPF